MIEKFTLDDEVFLVTKLAAGGDLLEHILKREKKHNIKLLDSWFTEEQVKHMFI